MGGIQRDLVDDAGEHTNAIGDVLRWPNEGSWTKVVSLAPMTLTYGFQVLSQAQVRSPFTINSRLGNMNTTDRNGRKNNDDNLGKFVCTPYLSHEGDTVYLCSNTVSGHAGVLPNGQKNCIARIPVLVDYGTVAHGSPELDKAWIDVGGLNLRTIRLTLRDHAGGLLDLGERDWSAQLVFGFPSG